MVGKIEVHDAGRGDVAGADEQMGFPGVTDENGHSRRKSMQGRWARPQNAV